LNKPKILVTGGCGYIGSHTIIDLIESGYEVISVDNGINSSPDIPDRIEAVTGTRILNLNIDLTNTHSVVSDLAPHGPFSGIIHFAALKSVGESVFKPTLYYQNNMGCLITTLVLMDELDIPHLIFSSSCTVYGSPATLPVNENTPFGKVESPYGATKQAGEILYEQYFLRSPGKSGISLRYFNPAGAHPSAKIGESPRQEAQALVPVITETAYGLRKELVVHGTDYPTRDGSCIRDFIDIMDLAHAHTLAINYLLEKKNLVSYEAFNLGIGEGVTVLEAIQAFEFSTGQKVNYRKGPRRAGDVPAIYADNSLINSRLGWQPRRNINDIMKSAWAWEVERRKQG
jgi:UDP-glucose 4-epimerase